MLANILSSSLDENILAQNYPITHRFGRMKFLRLRTFFIYIYSSKNKTETDNNRVRVRE